MSPVAHPSQAALDGLRVDGTRLLERLDEIARFGAIDIDGRPLASAEVPVGSSRLALTDADREGRDLVVRRMQELDLQVTVDEIGNVVGVRAASDGSVSDPVMTGSHIDTVATGGRFDGNLGVMAGLQVIETLNTSNVGTRRPVAVAFFTNEEGVRFQPDMMGSLVFAGGLPAADARRVLDSDGCVLGDELERIGYRGSAPCPGPTPHAFVELHIEQGPILEQRGCQVGAVTGVQGISWQQLRVLGQGNHAGTTPMITRRDAGLAAARITVFVDELARRSPSGQVATVGRLELFPNLINVIPGRAVLTIDLRNIDGAALAAAEQELSTFVSGLEHDYGVEVVARHLVRLDPVTFDESVVQLVEATSRSLGHEVMRIASGAGHDAQMLSRVAPTAMIFTTSRGGISHDPAEFTEAGDMTVAANVLLHTLLALAES